MKANEHYNQSGHFVCQLKKTYTAGSHKIVVAIPGL